MSVETEAAKLIASFEGYAPKAHWDVNAWRLGYGSDTYGVNQVRVTRGMTTSKADALANLVARIPEFEREIVRQIGGMWSNVPAAMKPALISVCYNYGHLPGNMADNIKHKQWRLLATDVDHLATDNEGINRKRRQAEADLIRKAIPEDGAKT